MNIVIIGSGNVATVLGRKFVKAGHHILQVFGRNAAAASALAYEWNTKSINYMSLVHPAADVYIIAVSDKAIAEIAKDMHLPGRVVVHTAAAVPMNVLASVTNNYGVFYPLQSLHKRIHTIPEVPIYTEAANEYTANILSTLAASISHDAVYTADVDKRTKLHVAAVIVNNFTNHIFSLAEEYCKKENLEFKELLPLIRTTIDRIQEASPSETQTGPAVRQDNETIIRHIELLQQHPKLLNIYKVLTDSIINK